MKDYKEHRRSSFSTLTGLANMGGLTALPEEDVDQDFEDSDDKIGGAQLRLPSIRGAYFEAARTDCPKPELSFLSTEQNVAIENTESPSEIEHGSCPFPDCDDQTSQNPSSKSSQTRRKSIRRASQDKTNSSTAGTSPSRRGKNSLVTASLTHSTQTTAEKGRFGSDKRDSNHSTMRHGAHNRSLISRRHSTETEQTDIRHAMSFEHGKQGSVRPRAHTWNSGTKLKTAGQFKKHGFRNRADTIDEPNSIDKRAKRKESIMINISVKATPDISRDKKLDRWESRESLVSADYDDANCGACTPSQSRPQNAKGGRRWSRPDFAETSRRVSLLLRAARGIGKRRGSRRPSLPTPNVLDEDVPIMPRFSSFMSAEAQYALMQGYEDRLADWLNQKFSGSLRLRRSSTPGQGVGIRRKSLRTSLDDADEEEEDEYEEKDESDAEKPSDSEESDEEYSPRLLYNTPQQSSMHKSLDENLETKQGCSAFYLTESLDCSDRQIAKSDMQQLFQQDASPSSQTSDREFSFNQSPPIASSSVPRFSITSTSTFLPMNPRRKNSDTSSIISEPPSDISNSREALRNLRRLSYPRAIDTRKIFGDEDDETIGGDRSFGSGPLLPLRRHGSLPAVTPGMLSCERRLAMTQRLENAMDILDALRAEEQGQGAGGTTLSPRAKVRQGRMDPLDDYNAWVTQWSREFKVAKSKVCTPRRSFEIT